MNYKLWFSYLVAPQIHLLFNLIYFINVCNISLNIFLLPCYLDTSTSYCCFYLGEYFYCEILNSTQLLSQSQRLCCFLWPLQAFAPRYHHWEYAFFFFFFLLCFMSLYKICPVHSVTSCPIQLHVQFILFFSYWNKCHCLIGQLVNRCDPV